MARRLFAKGCPIAFGDQVCGAYLSQLLTDLIGPNGTLRFKSQMRAPVYDGDFLVMKGRVIKKYAKDSENYVECEIRAKNQDGNVVAWGTATVTLPSKISLKNTLRGDVDLFYDSLYDFGFATVIVTRLR